MTTLTKHQLVELILAFDLSIGNLEREVTGLKKQQREHEKQLIELMENDGEQAFIDESGRKIARNDRMILTVKAADKERWFEWIEEIGRGDLVKTDINKNSLNAIIKKIIRGEEPKWSLPDFFDLQRDLFFLPRVDIKFGQRSLRKLAAESEME